MKYILLTSGSEADWGGDADLPKPDFQASFAFKGRLFVFSLLGFRSKKKKPSRDVETAVWLRLSRDDQGKATPCGVTPGRPESS
jgi:hypothetical protein